MSNYQGLKVDLDTTKIINWFGEPIVMNDQGLGPQYVIYTFLKLMENRKILPSDQLVIDDFIEKESKLDRSFFFVKGEEYLALELIQLAIISQRTSTIFALAKMIREKSKKKISHYFEQYKAETPSPCLENVSGKKSSLEQYYIMDDLVILGTKFANLRSEYSQMLSVSEMIFKNKHVLSSNFTVKSNKLSHAVTWDHPNNLLGFHNEEGDRHLVIVLNAPNVYTREYLTSCLLLNEVPMNKTEYQQTKKVDINIVEDSFSINIIGDTYPGEFYTDRRVKAGRWDPLIERGYDYCFEPLREYLKKATLNIANFEAALVEDRSDSRLWELKKFVLGGDPKQTIKALKKANIHALLLANNHLADYGESGIISTKKVLNDNNISFSGIGESFKEAARPLRIQTKNREIVIFNAYWYRQGNYRYFDFYPNVQNAGVNCLDGLLIEQVRWEKEQNPASLVIVSPHWGVDFHMTSNLQRNLAKKILTAGADLIIGHGPHTLQKIEDINRAPIIYSIGNGFFNSDGEYDGYPQSVPYGMIAELKVDNEQIKLLLRPIYSNNRETKWQPDFVSSEDFSEIIHFFERENSNLTKWTVRSNYLEMNLDI
ncbi:CapA family protein [Enterococcus sp. AZ196]|uniref:CapA family protein n=1 Tax=Enterococcus sp. AZ196 TaxID=2774659 RepID=UPI003D2AADB6